MFCPKCGRSVQEHASFCSNCGQVVDAAGASPAGAAPGPVPGASGAGTAAAWPDAARPLPSIVVRVKNILLTPKTEWPVIDVEPTSIPQLYMSYVAPLAALAALLSFVRMSVIGISMPFGGAFRTPFVSGLVLALTSFIFGLVGLFLVGLIINALAPRFAGVSNQRQALKTAAYAFTPAWLSAVLGLLPAFTTLLEFAAGLYGIYLLYLGLPVLMRSARERAGGYTAAVVVCTIVLGIVFGILSTLAGRFGGYSPLGPVDTSGLSRDERREQAAAAVGSMLGGVLGTDQKGKADLGAAMNNLAAAGQKIEQQEQASAPPVSTPSTPDPAAATQNAVAATAGLLTALGGAMGGNRRVDPVDFHDLKALLPQTLPGMQRTGAEGSSQQALGVKGSTATGNYAGTGGERMEIKIADISGVSGLLDAAGAMVQGVSSESDTGYEKDATIGGRTAHEKYDNRSKHGEVSLIVAKRFAVSVEGDQVDMQVLENTVGSQDLAKLDGMKDANVVSR